MTLRATRYVAPLRAGGSLPGLVAADDDGLYVAKFRGAGQGPGALVAEIVEDVAAAGVAWATELAANAPLSVTGNKRVLRALLDAKWRLDDETESELIALRKACFESEDFQEGVRAFAEKRPANWQGR